MTATENAAGKPRPPDKKRGASEASPDLLAITINVKTGDVVKIEGVNATGAHHELSENEKANLVKETGRATLEAIIEQAFEAGIACVLGDEADVDEPLGSKKDATLRHLLLQPLIETSAAKRLMRREILDRAILKTLIQHSPGSHPQPRE